MKTISTIFCLFFLITKYATAQTPPGNMPASPSSVSWETLNKKYNNPVVVLDDKTIPDSLSKQVLAKLDQLDVIKITVLHAITPKQNIVYLTTKDTKIAMYQKKLTAFSKEYKDFLETHQNRDGAVIYILNAVPVQGSRKGRIDELYNIPAERIKSVNFSLQDIPDKVVAMVEINTKQ